MCLPRSTPRTMFECIKKQQAIVTVVTEPPNIMNINLGFWLILLSDGRLTGSHSNDHSALRHHNLSSSMHAHVLRRGPHKFRIDPISHSWNATSAEYKSKPMHDFGFFSFNPRPPTGKISLWSRLCWELRFVTFMMPGWLHLRPLAHRTNTAFHKDLSSMFHRLIRLMNK